MKLHESVEEPLDKGLLRASAFPLLRSDGGEQEVAALAHGASPK